jgi:hypothetical protein
MTKASDRSAYPEHIDLLAPELGPSGRVAVELSSGGGPRAG